MSPLSLADLTLDVAVKHSLDINNASDLERFIWLPGKVAELKRILRDLSPFPDSGIQLLVCVLSELKESTRVDLSTFQLSGTQLAEILSSCGEITFLDASFNSILATDDIPKVLKVAPTLRRLVIMGCPSVSDAHILALVQNEPSRFKSLEGILHPAFLTIEKPDPYPTAFTFVNVRDTGNLACASMSFFTPAQVVQALIDVLPRGDAKQTVVLRTQLYPSWGSPRFTARGAHRTRSSANEQSYPCHSFHPDCPTVRRTSGYSSPPAPLSFRSAGGRSCGALCTSRSPKTRPPVPPFRRVAGQLPASSDARGGSTTSAASWSAWRKKGARCRPKPQ